MTPREWAATLGAICSPSFPRDAVEALVDMIPLIEHRYGLAAFNVETLSDIAAAKRRQVIPSFDDICAVIGPWLVAQRPVLQRIGADDGRPKLPAPQWQGPATEEERERIRETAAAFAAEVAAKEVRQAREAVTPQHLSKLQLALSLPREKAMQRPDLAAVLRAGGYVVEEVAVAAPHPSPPHKGEGIGERRAAG